MIREAINELKKYTLGKKNTEKVEISVLQLNRVIKALEQKTKTEPIYCDRNICFKNEYNSISCNECEVTKSQVSQESEE